MRKKLLFAFLLIVLTTTAQNLPHYKLTISETDLALMYARPEDETYYPAVFQVDTFTYNVQARFKGSTTLFYPKKSWAIKFNNKKNYFGVSRINLNADYKDYSNLRNFLIMRLFDYLGSPASKIKHVTYEVNNQPYGIYTQVEQINDEYLARNGRAPISIYKALNHGALMAPTVRDDYYSNIWQIELGGDPSFNELRNLFNKTLYWTKNDFDAHASEIIDVDNFLNFFAVHFVFLDMDNFTKNIFMNKNSQNVKYELLPWDNEGSFGNSAVGVFDSTSVTYNMRDAFTPEYQVVFQRLLENPTYRTVFKSKVNKIITDGFSYLDTLIDNTYSKIKQDVYLDNRKEATNQQFDNEIPKLKWFLAHRKTFLQANNIPERNVLTNFYCSNPLPTPSDPIINFRITSPVAQPVRMFFADSVDFNKFGQSFKFSSLRLYDDGLHNDLLANDLVYGNTLDATKFVGKLVPFALTGAEQNYPANGIFYIDYYGSKSYAINKGNINANLSSRLKIGNVSKYNNQNYVEIINTSSTLSSDLSYCHLRTNDPTNDFMFRDGIVILPNETIYIAPSLALGNQFFPTKRSFFTLPYAISTTDSLHLLSPVLTPIVSTKVNAVQTLTAKGSDIVINEINYKSGADKPTGDWVEIYNQGNVAVDMSGWIFKDGDNLHGFPFPSGFSLPADGYAIVTENITTFKAVYPNMPNVFGSTGFGLSSTGEAVRLYDKQGVLVDSVVYSSVAPWAPEAAGSGPTLELRNPALDNTLAENWYADTYKSGSPGAPNYLKASVGNLSQASFKLYPNPAKGMFFINSESGDLTVELLTLQGSILKTIQTQTGLEPGIDISYLPKGMYLVKISTNTDKLHVEKLIIK
ncbi:MAG: CotH kinase family protein [Paludibacter sp.]|nr:CotH kinase family protein [Paludibacter sp.]